MKILPFGVAVIEGDTHVSKWVLDQKRLDISRPYLTLLRKYLTPSTVAIDVGAMIGDHTIVYADWCKSVHAFEPNKEAFECLIHNMNRFSNVTVHNTALSDKAHSAEFSINENAGASFISESVAGDVECNTLDSFRIEDIGFIKIDAEGYETKILYGSIETIERDSPVMLIEVNSFALERAGSSRAELLSLISDLGYASSITDRRIREEDPQYDIFCLKK